MTRTTAVTITSLRFSTSLSADGSHVINNDAGCSAVDVPLVTDDPGLNGFGYTFTNGGGSELCVLAARLRGAGLFGRNDKVIASDLGGLYRDLEARSTEDWIPPAICPATGEEFRFSVESYWAGARAAEDAAAVIP